eukprot:CAMPEP_0115573828 /NCGR_PEP_ID=MMETSP0272-20121206/1207_1 /TAXON_ID=71861 /ORGANISM="Scrippsiella trochoidea, Strain CCMP3099" /LENGTH=75 /DNA_ID=CAMNT_0003008519 /DNA_START=878 /DNA_END=1105 /DNA_ORIENTATION=+
MTDAFFKRSIWRMQHIGKIINKPTPHRMGTVDFSSLIKQSGGASNNGVKDFVINSMEEVFKEKPPKMNAPLMMAR